MAVTAPRHQMIGEHMHDGIPFCICFPPDVLHAIKDFELIHGDILVATYPKTGSTWVSELLWLIMSDGDFHSANNKQIHERIPLLEITTDSRPQLSDIEKMPHPRMIKTHLPVSFFSKQLFRPEFKVIIPIRNPKDTLVSYYHFYRMNRFLGNFTGTWEEFFDDLVKTKHLCHADFFQWYTGWLQYSNLPNVKIIHYEDMKSNTKAVVEDLLHFLGKSLSPDLIVEIVEHLSFSQMKENKMTNRSTSLVFDVNISPFMRKGEVGDWKNYFTPQQNAHIDKEYTDKLQKDGVHLKFEL